MGTVDSVWWFIKSWLNYIGKLEGDNEANGYGCWRSSGEYSTN